MVNNFNNAFIDVTKVNSGELVSELSNDQSRGGGNVLNLTASLDVENNQLEDSSTVQTDSNHSNNLRDEHLPSIKVFNQPKLMYADVRDGTTSTRPLTELGNALRLLDLHGESLRFVSDARVWIKWDEAWQWDTTGASVRETASALATTIYREGANFNMKEAEHFLKWARISQSARTIDASISLLSDQGNIRLLLALLDSDPLLVGFDHARQVIDLRTGVVRPSSQLDYVTKSLGPNSVGDASKAIRWHSFLEEVFNGDVKLIDWLHRWCGYLLTGLTSEQFFLFLFGSGANGKSVFAELLRHIMGDYGRSIASSTLTEKKRQAGNASPDLADLIGCRLAMSAETEDGSALAESLIKSLTGGDTISTRKLYREPINFKPVLKLVMLGNHRPVVKGNDFGIWRRIRLVLFTRTFLEGERDPHLLETLKAEAVHILAWMIQGSLEWQRRGLSDTPASVDSLTAEYRSDQDIMGQWLAECTEANSTSKVEISELYTNYRTWAGDAGLESTNKISVGRQLSDRGYTKKRSNGKTLWNGLRLRLNNRPKVCQEE